MEGLSALIGVAGTLLGIVFSYIAFFRNSKKDSKDDGKEAGTMLTELGYIKANTDEIKTEQREQRKTNMEVVTRLTAVEASAKQAHKRIDRLENTPPREE
jgi:hypothetical protein